MENHRKGEVRQDGGMTDIPTGTKTTCNIAEMLKRLETVCAGLTGLISKSVLFNPSGDESLVRRPIRIGSHLLTHSGSCSWRWALVV